MSADEPKTAAFREPKLAINRIYTRHGDGGMTRLVGGQQIAKDDLRIECYGTLDELNALVGAARLHAVAQGAPLESLAAQLLRVQHALFNLGSLLATLPEDLRPQQPRVRAQDVEWLEACIDETQEELSPLRSFVLPGATMLNVALHQARTVCRRAERLCVTLARQTELDPVAIHWLNRLSDAFFAWSRLAVARVGAEELLWRPNEA